MLIWALSDGKAGHATQSSALAQALARAEGGDFVPKVTRRFDSRRLPAFALRRKWVNPELLCEDFSPPWPDWIVSCGSRASSVALAVKSSKAETKVACILRPAHGIGYYDAIVSPNHDSLKGKNVVPCCGALVAPGTQERLAGLALRGQFSSVSGAKAVILLGGPNRAFDFGKRVCSALAKKVCRAAEFSGMKVLAISSRRTSPAAIEALHRELGPDGYVWSGAGANPYWDALAAADAVVVTGDSVSMLSEACSSGRPVYIYELPLRRRFSSSKFLRFHRELVERGCAKTFDGELSAWSARTLDEISSVSVKVRDLLRAPN